MKLSTSEPRRPRRWPLFPSRRVKGSSGASALRDSIRRALAERPLTRLLPTLAIGAAGVVSRSSELSHFGALHRLCSRERSERGAESVSWLKIRAALALSRQVLVPRRGTTPLSLISQWPRSVAAGHWEHSACAWHKLKPTLAWLQVDWIGPRPKGERSEAFAAKAGPNPELDWAVGGLYDRFMWNTKRALRESMRFCKNIADKRWLVCNGSGIKR